MDLNSHIMLDATTAFPIQGLALSLPFKQYVPYMFTVIGKEYPRSIIRALRDALHGGAVLPKETMRSKNVMVIDPECLSEDQKLYKEFQYNARHAELLYQSECLTFRKDNQLLYVIDRGTNLPLALYIQ
ncbi:hypothetical protein RLO43_002010 [Escherichia coli]|nr:hypothetical protein [Escherichia coli]